AEIEKGGGNVGCIGDIGDIGDKDRSRALATPAVAAPVRPRHSEALGPVATYAPHGALQLLPLAALPLPGPAPGVPGAPGGPRFLSEVTTVALATAGGRAVGGVRSGPAEQPVFVVDPTGDLSGAERSLAA